MGCFLLTSLSLQVVALAAGAWSAARVARSWLRHGSVQGEDVVLVLGWAVGRLGIALLVAGYLFVRGVARLEEEG